MKLQSIISVLVLLLNATAALAESIREIHLGISPFLNESQRHQLGVALPELILEPARLAGGTRIVIWDAWQLVRVADFTIPFREFDTKRARAIKLQEPLRAVGQWLRATASREAAVPVDSAALKAPEWLFEASGYSATAGVHAFVLVGSPLYRSPREPSFDMGEEGRYPSDGHLTLHLQDSVFGLAIKTGRLDRSMVHWCHFDQSLWVNELHRYSVTRFWTLFVQGQGGTLATFSADLPAAFTRATQANLPAALRAQVDPADDKPVMRTAAPRAIPLWLQSLRSDPTNSASSGAVSTNTTPVPAPIATPDPQPEPVPMPAALPEPIQQAVPAPPPALTPIAEPKAPAPVPAPAPPPPPPPAAPSTVSAPAPEAFPVSPAANITGFGIAWATNGVDLDLYVKAHPRAAELYYRRTTTAEGRYYHDYRNRNVDLDYEYVELKNPVDLRQVKVWVNYYKGLARNVTGKVCVHYQGRTFIGDFKLAANYGNRGADSQLRASSPYWREINLEKLVGLASNRN